MTTQITHSTPVVEAPVWRQEVLSPARPALGKDIDLDVAIVGGGFTGLWTAYYLLKTDPKLRVAIFERETVGFGASGRNGGWASSIFPVSLARVAKLYSLPEALALQDAMDDTVAEIGRVAEAEAIDCDFSYSGYLALARNRAQLQVAKNTVTAAREIGLPDRWKLLTAADAGSLITAEGTLGAVFTEHCALLQPAKLVAGLSERIEELGGTIFEHTEVTAIDRGKLHTRGGRVTANVVVRATEAFTPQFRQFRREVAPLYSLVVATDVIPADLREQLGLNSRIAFNDLRHLRIYAHPTADGRLVFGGRGAPYHFGSKVDPSLDTNRRIHDKITRTMRGFFPDLIDVPVTHRWGGPLGVPRDWFPSVGYDRSQNMAWAGPYVGDGVATSNLAGRILTEKILGQSDELQHLPISKHQIKKWEPEPLRWVGVTAGLTATQVADAEERVTGRPSLVASALEKLTGAH